MKTKILLSLFFLFTTVSLIFSNTVIITNLGSSFKPASVNIQPGDTVVFDLEEDHNAVEVSQTTYNNNGPASNGGFQLDFGGGQVVLTAAGTYYYVCTPHAAFGMKGIINVGVATGSPSITSVSDEQKELGLIYPNPFSESFTLNFILNSPSRVTVELLDITGKTSGKLLDRDFETGRHAELINPEFLKPGQYLLHYRSGQVNQLRQLIKVK